MSNEGIETDKQGLLSHDALDKAESSGVPNLPLTVGPGISFFGLHRLSPNTSKLNMCVYYYVVMLTICVLVFINAVQPFVLTNYLNIDQDNQGEAAGDLSFYNELVVISTSLLWGYFSDKFGRIITYLFSFLLSAISLSLTPWASSLTVLILYRLIFAAGAAASAAMLSAVLGDYVLFQDRGIASGAVGLTAGFGALLAVFIFLQIPNWITSIWDWISISVAGYVMFYSIVIFCVISCIIILWGLRGRKYDVVTHPRIVDVFRDGFNEGIKNPVLSLSYAAGFGARGDSILVGVFLSLWINKSAIEAGYNEAAALSRAGVVSGVAQTCALLFSPIAGLICQKMNRVLGFVLLAGVSAFGYIYIFFCTDAMAWPVFVGASLVGCGEIGLVVSSTQLVAQEAPEPIRGSVSGFWGICGSCGILFATKLGGILFDDWRETGPFLLFGFLNIGLVIWGLVVFAFFPTSDKVDPKEKRNRNINGSGKQTETDYLVVPPPTA